MEWNGMEEWNEMDYKVNDIQYILRILRNKILWNTNNEFTNRNTIKTHV